MTTIDHAYIRNCNCNYLRNYAITKSGPVNTTFSDICGQVTLNLVSTVQHVKLDLHTEFISFHSQLWMNRYVVIPAKYNRKDLVPFSQ